MLPVKINPGVTVRAAGLLVIPSADTVIVVVLGNSPWARPLVELIEATLGLLLCHVRTAVVITFPALSLAVAVN
jgi:hypothetical protein